MAQMHGNIEGPGGVNNPAVEYIVNYVMNTPNNTNPNVLRSILTLIFEKMTSASDDINPGDVGDITVPGGKDKPIMDPVDS
jgi:hypothetical protein